MHAVLFSEIRSTSDNKYSEAMERADPIFLYLLHLLHEFSELYGAQYTPPNTFKLDRNQAVTPDWCTMAVQQPSTVHTCQCLQVHSNKVLQYTATQSGDICACSYSNHAADGVNKSPIE